MVAEPRGADRKLQRLRFKRTQGKDDAVGDVRRLPIAACRRHRKRGLPLTRTAVDGRHAIADRRVGTLNEHASRPNRLKRQVVVRQFKPRGGDVQGRRQSGLMLRMEAGIRIDDMRLHSLRQFQFHRLELVVLKPLQTHGVERNDDVVNLPVGRDVGRAEDDRLSGRRAVEDDVQERDRILPAVVPHLEVKSLVRGLRHAELQAGGGIRLNAAPASAEASGAVLLVSRERAFHQPAPADVEIRLARHLPRKINLEEALGIADSRDGRFRHPRRLGRRHRQLAARQIRRDRESRQERSVREETHLPRRQFKRHAKRMPRHRRRLPHRTIPGIPGEHERIPAEIRLRDAADALNAIETLAPERTPGPPGEQRLFVRPRLEAEVLAGAPCPDGEFAGLRQRHAPLDARVFTKPRPDRLPVLLRKDGERQERQGADKACFQKLLHLHFYFRQNIAFVLYQSHCRLRR